MNETLNGWAKKHPVGAVLVVVIRTILVALGIACLAVGVVLAPLPIPFGLPLIALGLITVAAASQTLHRIITRFLRRWPWVWKRIAFAFGEKADKTGGPAE